MSMLILVDYPEGGSIFDFDVGVTYTLIKDLGPFRLSYPPYNFDTGEGRKARITKIEEDKVTIEMDVASQVTPNQIAYIGEVASVEVPLFSYEGDRFKASRDKILSVAPNLHGPLPEGYLSENRLFLITLEDFLSYDYRQKSLEEEVDCLLYSLVKEPKIEKKIRNIAAHQIKPITDEYVSQATGKDCGQIVEMMKELFKCSLSEIDESVWNSYKTMNDYIIGQIGTSSDESVLPR